MTPTAPSQTQRPAPQDCAARAVAGRRIAAAAAVACLGAPASADIGTLSAQDAVALFERTCIAAAPSFETYDERVARAGLTRRTADGSATRETLRASLRLSRTDDGEASCTLRYHSGDTAAVVRRAYRARYRGLRRTGAGWQTRTTVGRLTFTTGTPVATIRAYEIRLDAP